MGVNFSLQQVSWYSEEVMKTYSYRLVPTPWLDDKHTIFGRATGGFDVIHSIESVRTDLNTDKPEEDISKYLCQKYLALRFRQANEIRQKF